MLGLADGAPRPSHVRAALVAELVERVFVHAREASPYYFTIVAEVVREQLHRPKAVFSNW